MKSGAIRIVRKAKDAKDAVVEIPAATVNKIREILRKRKGGGKVTDAEVCEAVHDAVEAGLEDVEEVRLGRTPSGSKAAGAPGKLFGLSKARQIGSYAESDLSRFALDFRKTARIGRKGNVVVVEYELNGVKQPLKAFSTVGARGSHGEFLAKGALPRGAKLTRLFSERQPCQLLIPNCDRMLARDFPDAEISFLVEYGDDASRRAGNAALDAILRELGL